jgi:hypothetical protein
MPKIILLESQKGHFRKAHLDEKELTEDEFNELIGMKNRASGYRISKYLEDFSKENPEYTIDVYEK